MRNLQKFCDEVSYYNALILLDSNAVDIIIIKVSALDLLFASSSLRSSSEIHIFCFGGITNEANNLFWYIPQLSVMRIVYRVLAWNLSLKYRKMKGDGEYNGRNVADVDISNESECQVLSATQ